MFRSMCPLVLSLLFAAACTTSQDSTFSGLPVSADVPAFRPMHLTGAFAGQEVCPVCTNGNAAQVQVLTTATHLSEGLDLALALREHAPDGATASLPVYLVVVGGEEAAVEQQSRQVQASEESLVVVHMPKLEGTDAALYQIHENPAVTTTVHWVTCRRVFARDVNLTAAEALVRSRAIWPKLVEFSKPYEITKSYIAPPWESGEPLVITGRVVDGDRKPITKRKLRAWQTNAKGLYNEPGNGRQEPTLAGLQWTEDDGGYRWETVKPAAYPSRTQPGHVHMELEREGEEPFWRTLWFEGDALIDDGQREWAAESVETVIIELRLVDGVWQGTHDIVVE